MEQGAMWPASFHVAFLAECSSFSPPTTVILLILLCFEALLFLIFTSVMFGTQVHSICTDETVSRVSTLSEPKSGVGAEGSGFRALSVPVTVVYAGLAGRMGMALPAALGGRLPLT